MMGHYSRTKGLAEASSRRAQALQQKGHPEGVDLVHADPGVDRSLVDESIFSVQCARQTSTSGRCGTPDTKLSTALINTNIAHLRVG